MSTETIRVGIVGAGGNTRNRHIPGLQAIDGVEVVGVCNRSEASSQKVVDEFGLEKTYAHWTDVVEDPDLDAVVIGTWPYMHCPVTCMALQEDKHVMCEARMAMNALEAHEMAEHARLYPHLVTQIVPSPFTLEFDQMMQELIADGYLGDIYAIELRGIAPEFADPSSPINWRQDLDMSGLNTLAMGIWYEALARWVGHASRVVAMRKTCVKTRPDPEQKKIAAIRIPDHIDILAEMACGAQAQMKFSAIMGCAEQAWDCWLYGSDGSLHLDMRAKKLFGAKKGDDAMQEINVPDEKKGEWRVEAEFIDAIRGKAPIQLTTFTEGLKYMEFTEAVARSADSGESVSLPLFE